MLEVTSLVVRYAGAARDALTCEALCIDAGEIVAVSGRSGSGKSTLGLAIIGLLPENTRMSGSIAFDGEILTPERQRRLRGRSIAWIPQDVGSAFAPFYTIGAQLSEVAPKARGRAGELITRLGIAADRLDEHPHRWSGGMLQRALVAAAFMQQTKLVIADEPTASLDAASKSAVADMLRDYAATGGSVVLITHDNELRVRLAKRTLAL